jgi:hypothetical protein
VRFFLKKRLFLRGIPLFIQLTRDPVHPGEEKNAPSLVLRRV